MRCSLILASIASLAVATTVENCSIVGTYNVQSGDTLTKIAASYNVTLAALEYENSQIPDFNYITVNESINIPNVGCTVDLCNIVANYTVVQGDTLTKIAAAYNVSLAALESVNTQIPNPNFIDVGDVIHIPATTCVVSGSGEATANCATGANSTYTVVSGDTFYIIANEKLQITLASFEAANPQVSNYNQIDIGQVLNVPVCGTCVDPSKSGPTYTVVRGDTFLIISTEKLNITLASFEAANTQVSDYNNIDIGELLNVPICKTSGTGSSGAPYPNTTTTAGAGYPYPTASIGFASPTITTTAATSTSTVIVSNTGSSMTGGVSGGAMAGVLLSGLIAFVGF